MWSISSEATKYSEDFKPRSPADKPRKKAKCWYCPEPWTYGHKCNNVKSMLQAIQLEGHGNSEYTTNSQDIYQDAPLTLPTLGRYEGHHKQNQPEENSEPSDTLMLISAKALHGMPGDTTLSVLVEIGGHQAVAVIDSGNTTTFMDSDFVKKTHLHQPTVEFI
jgi:hypothetical protein